MIKNSLTLIVALALFSCKQEVAKNYATVSGTITNHLGKDGKIRNRNYSKEIKINPDGTFSEGNLKWTSTTTDQRIALATMPVDFLGTASPDFEMP